MSRKTNYFKLGVFIIAGSVLLLGGIVLFGMTAMLKDTIRTETCFNESVAGLETGSPVKYRGVLIGNVAHIGFVPEKYPDVTGVPQRYVLVEMDLNTSVAKSLNIGSVEKALREEIAKGLRIRLTTQGLTGIAHLELNFFDPAANPPLPISWAPADPFIPSAPSTLSRLEQTFTSIAATLEDIQAINFKELADSLNGVFSSVNRALDEANVQDVGTLAAQNLVELRTALRRANELLAAKEAGTILPDASRAVGHVNRVLDASGDEVVAAAKGMHEATVSLNHVLHAVEGIVADGKVEEGLKRLPVIFDNANEAVQEISRGMVRLSSLLGNLNELALTQRTQVDAILSRTENLVNNLEELTGDAKRNPSRLIFGQPPRRVDPEQINSQP
ncbi:MAG: MlaD family protein [Desulfovibrionaceae bacterium]